MKSLIRLFLVSVCTIAFAGGALAQTHDHHHGNHGAGGAKPGLNQGKKWETDAPLRKGMESIRDTLQSNMHKVHEGKVSAADYAAMGTKIDAEIQGIFANCKLSPEADQVLHGVLEPMMSGTKMLQGKEGKPSAGYMKLMKAVNEYGTLFNHPGWKNVSH
jgi:hypothetical protein